MILQPTRRQSDKENEDDDESRADDGYGDDGDDNDGNGGGDRKGPLDRQMIWMDREMLTQT